MLPFILLTTTRKKIRFRYNDVITFQVSLGWPVVLRHWNVLTSQIRFSSSFFPHTLTPKSTTSDVNNLSCYEPVSDLKTRVIQISFKKKNKKTGRKCLWFAAKNRITLVRCTDVDYIFNSGSDLQFKKKSITNLWLTYQMVWLLIVNNF